MINIAGAFKHFENIKKLYINYLKFFKNNEITFYDGIGDCKWNGGRVNIYSGKYNKDILRFYNSKNIGVFLTFSNNIIDVNCEYGNFLLKELNEYNLNGVIIINEKLRQYIKEKYKNLKVMHSITGFHSLELNDYIFSELEEKYDYICPRFEWVFNNDFIKLINPKKYEIMTNDTCRYGCKLWGDHFNAIAKWNRDKEGDPHKIQECWLPNFDPSIGSEIDRKKYGKCLGMDLKKPEIEYAKSLGYIHFKISGREFGNEYYNEIENEIKNFI